MAYTHLGKSFPTPDTFENVTDLNDSMRHWFNGLCPARCIYLAKGNIWVDYCTRNGLDKTGFTLYNIRLQEDTKLFHVRSLKDVYRLRYYYSRYKYTHVPEKQRLANVHALLRALRRCDGEATPNYNDHCPSVVLNPKTHTVTFTRKGSKSQHLPELLFLLESQWTGLYRKFTDTRIDWNMMREHGYDGIEFHPEIIDLVKESKYEVDDVLSFIVWLGFPQTMVWNYKFIVD